MPRVSQFFFAAAIAFILWGVVSVRTTPSQEQSVAGAVVTETTEKSALSPDFSWKFNALDPGLPELVSERALFDPADDYWGLPREDGYDLVAGYCSACHSLRIVMQQQASRARWDELLTWMVEKQGMAEPPVSDREAMISYLSGSFGE